ncbi:hypothetical protein NL676_001832 [Syzygium grande]|nr:hypothetical protein NL676_001832 [Syzygium grande]
MAASGGRQWSTAVNGGALWHWAVVTAAGGGDGGRWLVDNGRRQEAAGEREAVGRRRRKAGGRWWRRTARGGSGQIAEEEKDPGPHDHLIRVYHFTKETTKKQLQVQNFGEPFLLVIHEDETLAEVKMRIQKKLQVPDDAFFMWKFAYLSLGHPEYLEDSEILSNRFERSNVYGEQYLGLEHSDAPKRSYVVNQHDLFPDLQNRHTHEKPVNTHN